MNDLDLIFLDASVTMEDLILAQEAAVLKANQVIVDNDYLDDSLEDAFAEFAYMDDFENAYK